MITDGRGRFAGNQKQPGRISWEWITASRRKRVGVIKCNDNNVYINISQAYSLAFLAVLIGLYRKSKSTARLSSSS